MIVSVYWFLSLIYPYAKLSRSLLYISGRVQLGHCLANLRLQNSRDADVNVIPIH